VSVEGIILKKTAVYAK